MRLQPIKESLLHAKIEGLNYCMGFTDEQIKNREIGVYVLDSAYGGYRLDRIINTSGGVHVISPDGYGTKRELYNFLCCYSG